MWPHFQNIQPTSLRLHGDRIEQLHSVRHWTASAQSYERYATLCLFVGQQRFRGASWTVLTIDGRLSLPLELSPDSHPICPTKWFLVAQTGHSLLGAFCACWKNSVTLDVPPSACIAWDIRYAFRLHIRPAKSAR